MVFVQNAFITARNGMCVLSYNRRIFFRMCIEFVAADEYMGL